MRLCRRSARWRIPERHGQDWLAKAQVEALEAVFNVPVALTDVIDERPHPRCPELGVPGRVIEAGADN